MELIWLFLCQLCKKCMFSLSATQTVCISVGWLSNDGHAMWPDLRAKFATYKLAYISLNSFFFFFVFKCVVAVVAHANEWVLSLRMEQAELSALRLCVGTNTAAKLSSFFIFRPTRFSVYSNHSLLMMRETSTYYVLCTISFVQNNKCRGFMNWLGVTSYHSTKREEKNFIYCLTG